jgi:hypothetical protein
MFTKIRPLVLHNQDDDAKSVSPRLFPYSSLPHAYLHPPWNSSSTAQIPYRIGHTTSFHFPSLLVLASSVPDFDLRLISCDIYILIPERGPYGCQCLETSIQSLNNYTLRHSLEIRQMVDV